MALEKSSNRIGLDPDPVASRFRAEAELLPYARDWLLEKVSAGTSHWLLIDEHLVGTRIPDLIAARVDLRAMRTRIRSERWASLNLGELSALNVLRPDRPTSVEGVAFAIGYTYDPCRRILRKLEDHGYVRQRGANGFVRVRTRDKLFTRFVALEAKLRDWRRSVVQARAHLAFAQETYVAFDAAYAGRFTAMMSHFQGLGTGLIAISTSGEVTPLLRARGNRRVDPMAFAYAGEQLWSRLQGVTRPLPQTRLPNAAALIAHRAGSGSPESRSKTLEKLLGDLEVPAPSRRH